MTRWMVVSLPETQHGFRPFWIIIVWPRGSAVFAFPFTNSLAHSPPSLNHTSQQWKFRMTPQAAQSNAVDINAFFTRILNSLALTLTFPYFLSFTLLLSLSPTHRSCRNNPKIQRHHAECGLGREYLKWSSSSSSNGENRSNERNLSTPSPPTTPQKILDMGLFESACAEFELDAFSPSTRSLYDRG